MLLLFRSKQKFMANLRYPSKSFFLAGNKGLSYCPQATQASPRTSPRHPCDKRLQHARVVLPQQQDGQDAAQQIPKIAWQYRHGGLLKSSKSSMTISHSSVLKPMVCPQKLEGFHRHKNTGLTWLKEQKTRWCWGVSKNWGDQSMCSVFSTGKQWSNMTIKFSGVPLGHRAFFEGRVRGPLGFAHQKPLASPPAQLLRANSGVPCLAPIALLIADIKPTTSFVTESPCENTQFQIPAGYLT